MQVWLGQHEPWVYDGAGDGYMGVPDTNLLIRMFEIFYYKKFKP